MHASWTYSKVLAWNHGGAGTSSDPICGQPFAIAGACIPKNVARLVDYSDTGKHTHNIVTNFTYPTATLTTLSRSKR